MLKKKKKTFAYWNKITETFDLGDLTDTVTLVVGVQSVSFPVRVNYPPASGSVTLTPASTDGIVFNPAVLTFTPTVDVQYITLTSNSLANRDPVVTWTVSGAEAANFIVPDPINTISVVGRTLSVSGSFGSSLVNTPSTPIVITSDYVVGSLTITPSASDLVFTPASQTLSATSKFVAFTATYPTWKDTNSEVDIAVQFVFSGANAEWYNPLSAQNFHAVQSMPFKQISFFNCIIFINTEINRVNQIQYQCHQPRSWQTRSWNYLHYTSCPREWTPTYLLSPNWNHFHSCCGYLCSWTICRFYSCDC